MAADDIQVQHGSITFGASADTATATITAVASTASAFVICLGVINTSTGVSGSSNNPDDISVKLEFTNTTTITATRLSTGNNSDVTVHFAVVEYVGAASGANEFKVVRYSAGISGGSTSIGSPTWGSWTANTNNSPSIYIPGGHTHSATSHDGNSMAWYAYGDVENQGSTGRATNNGRPSSSSTGALDFEVQMVEFTGSNWKVLHGYGTTGGTESSPVEIFPEDDTGTEPEGSWDWSKAFIVATKEISRVPDGTGGWTDDHDDANDMGFIVYPGDGDGDGDVSVFVAHSNASNDATRFQVFAQCVYNSDSTFLSVEHIRSIASGSESSLTASTTDDYSITDVGDTAYAFPIAYAYTDDTSHDLAHAGYQAHLTSTSNLRFERSQSTGTGEFAAQIIKFEYTASTIEPGLHSSSTTHHTLALATMPVLGLHSSSTTHHTLALPSDIAHRDTRYYASGTIATDLGQYETDLTASGVGAYEVSSSRTHITGERNVYYRGDLSTADSQDILVRHGDQTTSTTNTYALVVKTGGTAVQAYYGSTLLIEAEIPGASGTDQLIHVGWSTRANPDTTGASDAECSELWVLNEDTGSARIAHATHAAPTGLSTYTFSVAGWWDGATMQDAPANAPEAVRVGTTYYSHIQYLDDFVSATPYATDYETRDTKAPVWKASGAASEGEWLGWQTQYAARAANAADLRLASPIVNAVYRDAETLYWDGSGLYEPEKRHQYGPGGQTAYQMATSYLWWGKLPLTYSRVRVRVCVSSYPTSGADVPLGMTCYSMDRPPPWPCNWKRSPPVVATYSHTTRSDREWVDLGELELVRLVTPEAAYNHTTHLALGYAIDPESASADATVARVVIHAWQVVPVIPSAVLGPEQGLQPAPPTTPLQPFQLLSGG